MRDIIATLRIKPGTEAKFEAIAAELTAEVRKNEPGCVLYYLARGDTPQLYMFIERYVDQAAIETHRATKWYNDLVPRLRECFEVPAHLELLTEL